MPFTSLAQARYMYAKKPQLAKEFASKTNFSTLPEHVSSSKNKKIKKKSSAKSANKK